MSKYIIGHNKTDTPFGVGNNLDEHFPQTRGSHDRNLVKACLTAIYLFCYWENKSLTCY